MNLETDAELFERAKVTPVDMDAARNWVRSFVRAALSKDYTNLDGEGKPKLKLIAAGIYYRLWFSLGT